MARTLATRKPARSSEPVANGHAAAPGKPAVNDGVDGSNGRDPHTGKFLPGNRCGKGNPHYRAIAENRRRFLAAVTGDDLAKLARKLLALALEGDMAAVRLLLDYCLGKPPENIDPDDVDADELRRWRAMPSAEDVKTPSQKVSVPFALAVMRAVVSVAQEGALTNTRLDTPALRRTVGTELDAAGLGDVVVKARRRRSELRDLP